MRQLSQIQKAIIEELSADPVNKGIVRRVVKLKDESFDVNHTAFDAQVNSLVDMGLVEKHGDSDVVLTKDGQRFLESSVN